jgi:glycerol-3-phosphate acyltransferase PlsY
VLPFLSIVLAYLLGSIPFGYLLVRWRTGSDIRRAGSGNIGATNVFRTTSRAIGVATLVLDALKAFLAVWIAARLTGGNELVTNLAALAALVGHAFPVFLNFKGGKAVASFLGAYLYLAPIPVAAVAVVFFATVWRTRFISLGSLMGAITFPLAVWIIQRPQHWPLIVCSILSCALVIWRHQGNIVRLRSGQEHAFSVRRARTS